MRRLNNKLTLLAAALMLLAVPALAADEGAIMEQAVEQEQPSGKDECLLVAANCGNQVDTIQQRIDRIERELLRGADVYTNDELNKLNSDLDEANKTLEGLSIGG